MTEHTTPVTTDDVPDEILRSIHIEASAETVYEIVSEPGWFINDNEFPDHEITTEDDVSRVVDPILGEFHIGTVELEPPRRAVFRWLGGGVGKLEDFPANTVEFTIEPDGDGVLLTVRERGFASISEDAAVRRHQFEENSEGWEMELDIAKQLAERA